MGRATNYVNLDVEKLSKYLDENRISKEKISIALGKGKAYLYQRLSKYNTMNADTYKKLCDLFNLRYEDFSTDGKHVFDLKPRVTIGRRPNKVRINSEKLKTAIEDYKTINNLSSNKCGMYTLSRLLGKSHSYLSTAISNEVIDKAALFTLCNYLDININDIIKEECKAAREGSNPKGKVITLKDDNGHEEQYMAIKLTDYQYDQMKMRKYIQEINFRLQKLEELI